MRHRDFWHVSVVQPFAAGIIQEYLVILGYEPGNIDGVRDDLTRVAISQFQAEEGFPVTGEPSAQLAAQLLAAVTG